MYRTCGRQVSWNNIESLESRLVMDCAGVLAGIVDFEPSEFVKLRPGGSVQFASMVVGETHELGGGSTILDDDSDSFEFGDSSLTTRQLKAYVHQFADSIGTDLIIETLDFRQTPWGHGSGSTTRRFEDFVDDQLADVQPCTDLRFGADVRFELPGEGGKLFTGGWLDLNADGRGSLLRGGDIAEVVESYVIESDINGATLTVNAQLGKMEFVINGDRTLTDEFDRIWKAEDEYQIVDPISVDKLLGDIDGNGAVDFADFLILSENFGKSGGADQGDLDDDGVVNFEDFLLFAEQFGKND